MYVCMDVCMHACMYVCSYVVVCCVVLYCVLMGLRTLQLMMVSLLLTHIGLIW